jgi:predicted transcriptional regulator
MSYYNTTNIKGKELEKVVKTTKTQDAMVLSFLRHNPTLKLTKHGVYEELIKQGYLNRDRTPDTSIGRSLNTLMHGGYVLKLPEREKGKYGRRNYLYTLNQEKGGN